MFDENELKILNQGKSYDWTYEKATNYPVDTKVIQGEIIKVENRKLGDTDKPVIQVTEGSETKFFVLNVTQREQIKRLKSRMVLVRVDSTKFKGRDINTFVFCDPV